MPIWRESMSNGRERVSKEDVLPTWRESLSTGGKELVSKHINRETKP